MGNRSSSNSSSDSDREDFWGDLKGYDSDDSHRKRRKSSPPAKKPKIELKYGDENVDDEDDTEYIKCSYFFYKDNGSCLKVKYSWSINEFSESDVVKDKGSIRSPVYIAGDYNQFQYYFVMQKVVVDDETQFGVYVTPLNLDRSEATVYYKAYLIDSRADKHILPKRGSKCGRKGGFKFLGYMCKNAILGEDSWSYRMVPDDELTLDIKITVNYKSFQPFLHLEQLFSNNQINDVTIVVKNQQFPANKTILSERCPVFKTLLEKDKNCKKLQINNVEPDIMKELLLYIYTGHVKKLFTNAKKLSTAAGKYKLKELKAMCKKIKAT